ncbi:hypothetical protein CYMTET_50264 [Cymbomonas tetramitiformis]|uniref:PKD/REJ-like domain-containing protein n=1 Tax=Cymbomonas tetramitiformis TaxID=36881 RepID=A0AAE0BNH5_9CHLO|nr:hypothetical protein CYMTET_50264 [Cymbomonas tetramitiformis]
MGALFACIISLDHHIVHTGINRLVGSHHSLKPISTVESTAPEALARTWTVIPEEGTDPLDLAAAAATALTTADLAVRAGTLTCGGAYIFRLAVEDSVRLASTAMRVVVNSPPSSGALTMTPASIRQRNFSSDYNKEREHTTRIIGVC